MARTVKFTYDTRVDGGGQPYPASRDDTAPFFLFGLLISYPSVIVQGYSPRHPKGKGWWVTCRDSQGKATAVITDRAVWTTLLTWTAVEIYSPAGA